MTIRPTFSSENTKVRIAKYVNPVNQHETCYKYTYMVLKSYPWTFSERFMFNDWRSIFSGQISLPEHENLFVLKYLEIEAGKYGY